jgi:valyl-tRNA synthetase
MDIAKLPKHFDWQTAERTWSARWEAERLYGSPDQLDTIDRSRLFVIDTPPPTVSGSLHIGHIFSYTQTDLIARFHRMRGKVVVYPMGWDDNGLPTERRVQNYFNVRCNPGLQKNPNLQLPGPEETDTKSPPTEISRSDFIELCLRLTADDEKAFKDLWIRVGLSVDWRREYSTIDRRSRASAQLSFLDLWRKGHIYSIEAPSMWDVDFQTTVAQAEVEDKEADGYFYHLQFGVEDSTGNFMIATTRPELLPACVAVTAHPDDPRYRHLFGRRAVTPLFRVPVPIFPSDLADPEKGTGILMVCTFGDATDVHWWREQRLPLRQILGRDGRLLPVNFAEPNWPSISPEGADRYYSAIVGKSMKQARNIIVNLLRDPGGAATGNDAPLAGEPVPIKHSVKFYEKGDQPLEFIASRQWFVRLLDKKASLLESGNRIQWHPDFMRHRYVSWTENLAFDWAISRQRYFGVPFPVWYAVSPEGKIEYEQPIIAPQSMLPVDPLETAPPGFSESQRNQPGGFAAENDVFDTWFTSSLTPQIAGRWGEDPNSFKKIFPMDLRPQSHEIIRTWAFYTIAKAHLHENEIPWKHIAISGWILDPDNRGKLSKTPRKMSKSLGNVITPVHLLDQYGSDAVRYWASSAQLGSDTAFDENVLKIGKRLVTKIFNASKFVLTREGALAPITYPLDRVFLHRLLELVQRATGALEGFEYQKALSETERFFWTLFTNSFIELSRSRAQGALGPEVQGSAISSLHLALNVLLRLFAPFLPFITEEVWSWMYATETGHHSIHTEPWPAEADFAAVAPFENSSLMDVATEALAAINRGRSSSEVSAAREIQNVVLAVAPAALESLTIVKDDVRLASRAHSLAIFSDAVLPLAESSIEVRELQFVSTA